MIKFQTLPKTLKTRAHPIWELHRSGDLHPRTSVDRNTKVLTLFVKEISHSHEWCRREVAGKCLSQQYCQKLTGFIRWSGHNVVDQCILQRCCRRNQHHFFRCSTFWSFEWPKLTQALGKFAVIHLICFVLGTILEENERLAGKLLPEHSRYRRVLCLQVWLFRKSLLFFTWFFSSARLAIAHTSPSVAAELQTHSAKAKLGLAHPYQSPVRGNRMTSFVRASLPSVATELQTYSAKATLGSASLIRTSLPVRGNRMTSFAYLILSGLFKQGF